MPAPIRRHRAYTVPIVMGLPRWVRSVKAIVGVLVLAACVSYQGHHAVASASPAPRPAGRMIACSSSVARAPMLGTVQTTFIGGLPSPFGVVFSSAGHFVFADSPLSVLGSGSEIAVYGWGPDGRLVAESTGTFPGTQLLGMSRSPDGRYLAAADNGGAEVFSISQMEIPGSPPSSWRVGSLASAGQGAIESSFSPDGDYLFVTLENSSELAVFDVERAVHDGFGPSDLVGYVPLGLSPVGVTVSPNGRYLYATSEEDPSASAHRISGSNATAGGEGTLSTIDLRRAKHDPSHAVISTVWAGCSPVRVVATDSKVYVTARGSDELIAFSVSRLASHPLLAMTETTPVGESPVGLALVAGGRTVLVADSNRFDVKGTTSNLAVVSKSAGAKLELVGYIRADQFPRDMAVNPDGKTLVVSNYGSGQVENVVLAELPRSP